MVLNFVCYNKLGLKNYGPAWVASQNNLIVILGSHAKASVIFKTLPVDFNVQPGCRMADNKY